MDVHAAVDKPDEEPNNPAAHSVHALAPAALYLPALHCAAVAFVDPVAHAYPAVHVPEQDAVDKPAVEPKKPAAHSVHVEEPAKLYCPGGH